AEQLGKFGVGFLSIFRDAEKVEIKTGNGNHTVHLIASPVYDDDGQIFDIDIQYQTDDEPFKGTKIRKHMSGELKSLQSAFIQDSVIRYGTHVDASAMPILFNNEAINRPVKQLIGLDIEGVG